MKKIGKFFLIIIVIGAIGYGFFMFVVSPKFNNDKITLTTSFYQNITEADACEVHFNPETTSYCATYKSLLGSSTFVVDSITASGDDVIVTLSIGTSSEDFIVSFIEEENTGITGFFHKTIYYIDLIQ